MRLRLATALAALCALVPAAPAAEAAPAYRGIQMMPVRTDSPADGISKELDLARRARANLVKSDVSWAELEPQPGAYSEAYLSRIDQLTRGAAKRGLKVMLLLQATPCWDVRAAQADCAAGGSAQPPADFDAYGRAAALLAKRFGSRLAAIEVWNEPDHVNEEYWKGDDKAGKYAQLLRATYRPVKAANSRVAVLGGSLVGASGEFLKQLYDAGIKGHYDGLSVHYYDLVLASLRSIREAQRKNGDSKPLWLTEFGFTSCYPRQRTQEGHRCVSAREQGTFLLDVFKALRRTSYVRAGVIYNMRDTEQYSFGLATPELEPKRSLRDLARAFARPLAAPRPIRLGESRSGVSGSAPVGDVLKLQAFRGACRRQSSASRPRYEVFDMKLVRGRFNWRVPALRSGRWCIYAEQYWTKRKALVDLS